MRTYEELARAAIALVDEAGGGGPDVVLEVTGPERLVIQDEVEREGDWHRMWYCPHTNLPIFLGCRLKAVKG